MMHLNHDLRRLEYRGRSAMLTPRQYGIVSLLMNRPDCIFSRDQIMDVLDPTFERELYQRSIDSIIKKIRIHLRDISGGHAEWLVTVYGGGYYWDSTFHPHGKPVLPAPEIRGRDKLFSLWGLTNDAGGSSSRTHHNEPLENDNENHPHKPRK